MKKYIITFLVIILIAVIATFVFLKKRNAPTPDGSAGGSFPSSSGTRDLGSGSSPSPTFPSATNPNGNDTSLGNGTQSGGNETPTTGGEAVEDMKLARKISEAPVSGLTSFGNGKDLNLTVRYVDQGSGNVWDYHPIGDTRERVSQNTILRVKDVVWGNNGQTAILRYFDDKGETLKNYSLRIPVIGGSSTSSSGYFLPENILSFLVAPPGGERIDPKTKKVTGTKLTYLSKDSAESFNISVTDFDKKPTVSPYFTNFGQWNISWPTMSTYLFVTKHSSDLPGFAYTASASASGKNNLFANLKPILRNIPGLTANMNTTGSILAYTRMTSRSVTNFTHNMKTGEDTKLPISTFVAEKCVWDKKITTKIYCAVPRQNLSGSTLENWYLGYARTSDDIYSLDTDTGTLTLLYKPDASLDAARLVVSDDSSYLFFQDKNDGYLWALQLTELKP